MSTQFNQLVAKMPELLKTLDESQPFLIKDNLTDLPKQGVYVFYENDRAMYVGRSNRLKERLREHSQSRQHYSATLAIKIAKKNMSTLQTVKQLMDNEDFKKEFKDARDRIARMKIRCVKIENQIEQAMFEIYAHLERGTELNDFKTT